MKVYVGSGGKASSFLDVCSSSGWLSAWRYRHINPEQRTPVAHWGLGENVLLWHLKSRRWRRYAPSKRRKFNYLESSTSVVWKLVWSLFSGQGWKIDSLRRLLLRPQINFPLIHSLTWGTFWSRDFLFFNLFIVNLEEFWKNSMPEKKRAAAVLGQILYFFFKAKLEILLPSVLYYTDLPVPFIAAIFCWSA